MNNHKLIDTSIAKIKALLGDVNNELSLEQREELTASIIELKRLQKAKITREDLYLVVQRISRVVHEVIEAKVSA